MARVSMFCFCLLAMSLLCVLEIHAQTAKKAVNSRKGVNDWVIPWFKLDQHVDQALLHGLLVTYKRGTVTNFDIVACDKVDVPGNGVKYQMYVEIILGTTPCYVDYMEVWESEVPQGLDLTEQHKTSIPCRAKSYAKSIINAGHYNQQNAESITIFDIVPTST